MMEDHRLAGEQSPWGISVEGASSEACCHRLLPSPGGTTGHLHLSLDLRGEARRGSGGFFDISFAHSAFLEHHLLQVRSRAGS